MKRTHSLLYGALLASLAAPLPGSGGKAVAEPVVADGSAASIDISQLSLTDRAIARNGGRISGSGATITHAAHDVPTVLAEHPGSVIDLQGGSITASLIGDGSIDRLSSTAVQAFQGGSIFLQDLTINANATGGGSASRSIGISVRNHSVLPPTQTTSLTASGVTINVGGQSIQAHDGYGVGAVYQGALITLQDDSVINASGAYHYGIFAGVGGAVNSTGTAITTTGQRGIGVYANAAQRGGAVINLTGDSVHTSGNDAHALFAIRQSGTSARDGLNGVNHTSTINADGVTIETTGNFSVGALAERGGHINLVDSTITTSGIASAGLAAQLLTSDPVVAAPTSLSATSTSVTTSGHSAFGVASARGATVTLTDVTVNTSGENAHGILATGVADLTGLDQSSIDKSIVSGTPATLTGTGVTVTTTHATASTVMAEKGASVNLRDSIITGASTEYPNGVVYAREAGQIVIEDSTVTNTSTGFGNAVNAQDEGSLVRLVNTDISTAGIGIAGDKLTSGVYASKGGRAELEGGSVSTTGNRAIGLRAAHTGSSIHAKGTEVSTLGSGSHGVHVFRDMGSAEDNISVVLDGGHVQTAGNNAYGLYAQNTNASITSSADITTYGVTGFGAFVYGGGHIELTGGNITTHADELVEPSRVVGTYGLIAAGASSKISTTENTGGSAQTGDGSGAVSVTTHGIGATAVRADTGGEIDLSNARISTGGERAHGVQAVDAGSVASISQSVVETSGAAAAGAFAGSGGTVSLHRSGVRTSGAGAPALYATGSAATGRSNLYAYNSSVTSGAGSPALLAEGNAAIRTIDSTIDSGSYGAQINTANGETTEISLGSTTMNSADTAFSVRHGGEGAAIANITADGSSTIASANNVLLEVSRADGGGTGTVNLHLGNPQGYESQSVVTIARGDILNHSTNPSDRINIYIGSDARLYGDRIEGYSGLTVNGVLGSNTPAAPGASTALSIGLGQSVSGSGIIEKDVVLSGGSLSTDVRIRGSLDLGEDARESVSVGDGQSVSIDSGKQAIIDTVSNATVDATQGAAVINAVSEGSTVKTGNWGASIQSVTGGVIDASTGTANIASFEGGATLQTGSGGATVGKLAGGSVSGSGAAESQVSVTELAGGNIAGVKLVVSNDGTASTPAGNVALESAVIGGNGTVNASLALSNSVFAAGSSVGNLNIAENLTLDSQSIYEWEINNALGQPGQYSGGWDFSNIAGMLEFDEGARFQIVSLSSENLAGETANFDELTSYNWLVAVAEQGITGWEALALELDGFLNDYTGTFSLSVAQNSEGQYELYVNYTAVPEPTTLALLLGGAALLATLAIRRRQDRSAASRQT